MRFFPVVALLCLRLNSYCQLNVNYISASQFVQHLAGPGITITNPLFSGTDPVQMASFSGSTVPNVGDPSSGPCTNCQYFIDNTNGITFQYNGYTTPITIKFEVTPCTVYHFWIGVADAQDFIYDSAILLPDGSFRATGSPEISA